MTLRSRLKGAAIGAFVGGPGQSLRRAAAEARRRVRREPRVAHFFHDVADPWSYLTAQAVARLAERYPTIEWKFHVVSAPASDVDSQPKARVAYAMRDAVEFAQHWDVAFPAAPRTVESIAARWCGSVLIRERPFADQLRAAIELGEAAWRGDTTALQAVVGRWGHEAHLAVAPALAAGYERLRAAGHYQGAMIEYRGQWYWGLDRIPHLEAALAEDADADAGTGVLAQRPADTRAPARLAPGDAPLPVDVWWSFRSPYSYLALDRIAALADRFPIELRWRPILPMVERGVPAPRIKRMYIVFDAKREADRLGVPFGQIADPLGQGIAHLLPIAKLAVERGDPLPLLRSAARGVWSEALDAADLGDLRIMVERAGIAWDDARAAIDDDAWKAWANQNATDLTALGLWGVPSFRAGDYVAWGQDRLPMLEDRLRRHFAAPPTTTPDPG